MYDGWPDSQRVDAGTDDFAPKTVGRSLTTNYHHRQTVKRP
jgi:hypothetical protein